MIDKVHVLFVCLGNICRSPTAHGVFERLVRDAGLEQRIAVDSAGTGDWHIGRPPDQRSHRAALERGVDIGHLRARQVTAADFDRYQYILAMDRSNLDALHRLKPEDYRGHLGLFLAFAGDRSGALDEVPDPYHGGDDDFQRVYELIQRASLGLLDHIREAS
ncbi:MAG: low molecular weight protein-tyrosine-phosphatase [Porticoccaceae bacterium]